MAMANFESITVKVTNVAQPSFDSRNQNRISLLKIKFHAIHFGPSQILQD
jgi:hypothetical protein